MADYIGCPGCDKQIVRNTTKPERYRKHKPFKGATADNADCDFSGTVVQEEECDSTPAPTAPSTTASSAQSPKGAATDPAEPATSSTDSSPNSQESGDDASMSAPASPVIPGVTSYVNTLAEAQETQTAEYRERVEAGLTPFAQPTPPEYERPTLFSQPVGGEVFTRPASEAGNLFSQPAGRKSEQPVVEMSTDAASIAARLKELFYAYDNRKSSDNRSAQTTMGPSEMGTPCDRRLALSLMRMPPVNPGGDGWAAFVGTCIHAGLEQMFVWADAGTGRFAVEQRLEFGHPIVPKGTADLLDRVLLMVLDHKCQGRWSRNKLKTQGPIPTYRVQAHVYAHGMRLKGEKIEKVAIVSWPRDESTLDDLYVHVEDYNPGLVKDAFRRVEDIQESIEDNVAEMNRIFPDAEELEIKARVAQNYTVADDCRFCPFYLPNTRDPLRGCNGKR